MSRVKSDQGLKTLVDRFHLSIINRYKLMSTLVYIILGFFPRLIESHTVSRALKGLRSEQHGLVFDILCLNSRRDQIIHWRKWIKFTMR